MKAVKNIITVVIMTTIHLVATLTFVLAAFLHGFNFGPEIDVFGYATFGKLLEGVVPVLVFPASQFGPTRFWFPVLIGNSLLWGTIATGLFIGCRTLVRNNKKRPNNGVYRI